MLQKIMSDHFILPWILTYFFSIDLLLAVWDVEKGLRAWPELLFHHRHALLLCSTPPQLQLYLLWREHHLQRILFAPLSTWRSRISEARLPLQGSFWRPVKDRKHQELALWFINAYYFSSTRRSTSTSISISIGVMMIVVIIAITTKQEERKVCLLETKRAIFFNE